MKNKHIFYLIFISVILGGITGKILAEIYLYG